MQKRVLILFAYPLDPAQDSASLRMSCLVQLLKKYSIEITFAVSDDFAAQQQAHVLQDLGIQRLNPACGTLASYLAEHGGAYDLIWMSSVSVAQNYLETV